MNDRVWGIITALCGVVIIICFIFNAKSVTNTAVFDMHDTFYVPKDLQPEESENAIQLYKELTGSRGLSCPCTTLSKSDKAVRVVYSGEQSPHKTTYWLFESGDESTVDYDTVMAKPSTGEVTASIIAGDIDKCEEVTVDTFGVRQDAGIIAPFGFTFGNNNTDKEDEETIVIYNSAKDIRITFTNVANWFCAGPYGTDTKIGSGTDAITAGWYDHHKHHQSIIGMSSNAVIKGGGAGDLIGYANSDTRIKIELKDSSNAWTVISIKSLLCGS